MRNLSVPALRLGLAHRLAVVTMTVLTLFVFVGSVSGQSPTDGQLKAAFLFNFGQYVRWPSDGIASETGPFVICVLRDDSMAADVRSTVAGRQIDGRTVEVRSNESPGEIEGCHILFVGSQQRSQIADVLDALQGHSVLTVAEMPSFANRGGMINMYRDGPRYRFEINTAAAERAGLRLSAKLLSLATIVESSEGMGSTPRAELPGRSDAP